MGMCLTEWCKLKGSNLEVVWCKTDSKYNWREGEQDKLKHWIKAVSVSLYVEAARDASERSEIGRAHV